MNMDILKYIFSDWPRASAEINKAGPYEILISFFFVVLGIYVVVNLLVFILYRPNSMKIPDTVRKIPQVLALSCGSIGLLLTILDSRAVPLERDYSAERRQISQNYQNLKSALSGAVKGCDQIEFSDLSLVKEEAIAKLYSCAFKNEFDASLPNSYSFLLTEPKVLTAYERGRLDDLLADAVATVEADYERALQLSETYLSAHIEFGVDDKNPIVVGLKDLPNKIEKIATQVQSSSVIFADQVVNDEAVRSFKSQTMLFILLMLVGLAVEFCLLAPSGKWLKELRIKWLERRITKAAKKRAEETARNEALSDEQ